MPYLAKKARTKIKENMLKILITGGAGFIGSNISDTYIQNGHKVIIVDNLSTGKKENLNPKAKFYLADVSDSKKLESIFKKEKPDIVNHHAAQLDVRKSVQDPTFDAKINILGSLNVLQNCVKYKTKKIIFASSGGTIYGECIKSPANETKQGEPLSPYGISKFATEFYIKSFAQLHGLKYTILRYANVFGPRQDPHGEAGVVAIFTGKMLCNEDLFIFGNGKQLRDYVYVGDLVRANLIALNKGNNETINIGTQKGSSVNDLYKVMANIIGYKKHPIYKPARAGELFKSVLAINKAMKVLKWKPETNIENGLKNTINFFKNRKNI